MSIKELESHSVFKYYREKQTNQINQLECVFCVFLLFYFSFCCLVMICLYFLFPWVFVSHHCESVQQLLFLLALLSLQKLRFEARLPKKQNTNLLKTVFTSCVVKSAPERYICKTHTHTHKRAILSQWKCLCDFVVCSFSAQRYLMIGWAGPSWCRVGKTKSRHGNSQGWRRRVCLWCSAVFKRTLAGRTVEKRPVVLCHCLCSPAPPGSHTSPLLSSRSKSETWQRTNAES